MRLFDFANIRYLILKIREVYPPANYEECSQTEAQRGYTPLQGYTWVKVEPGLDPALPLPSIGVVTSYESRLGSHLPGVQILALPLID